MRRNNLKSLRTYEKLEDRQMMAGDIAFDSGILKITGGDLDDQALVRLVQDGNIYNVRVDLFARDADGTDHLWKDYDIEYVSKIVFNAGAGNDRMTVFVSGFESDAFEVESVELEFNGEAGDDILDNTDPQGGIKTTANGGADNDTLEGSRFDDTIEGGLGNDIMTGYRGNDTYVFSDPNFNTDEIHEAANVDADKLDFSEFERAVFVNLDRVYDPNSPNPQFTQAVTTFNFGQIRLFSSMAIEDVIGTAFEDTIRGNSRPNHFWAGGDDDTLEGRGGNDILEGQGGSDIYEFSGTSLGIDEIVEAANSDDDGLRFSGMSSGVNVDLSRAGPELAVNSAALRLRLANDTAIERVWGSEFADTITGNTRNNTLWGLDGNDVISGGGGADDLYGGDGGDQLWTDALDQAYGGAGLDTFDQFNELLTVVNPRRTRYLDWRTF